MLSSERAKIMKKMIVSLSAVALVVALAIPAMAKPIDVSNNATKTVAAGITIDSWNNKGTKEVTVTISEDAAEGSLTVFYGNAKPQAFMTFDTTVATEWKVNVPQGGVSYDWKQYVDLSALIAAMYETMNYVQADYTYDSWQALKAAFDNAQDVAWYAAGGFAKDWQAQVDAATAAIWDAIDGLVPVADYSDLYYAIHTWPEFGPDAYTQDSWAVYKDAFDAAQVLIYEVKLLDVVIEDHLLGELRYSNAAAEDWQDDINAAAEALYAAIAALELKPVKSVLEKLNDALANGDWTGTGPIVVTVDGVDYSFTSNSGNYNGNGTLFCTIDGVEYKLERNNNGPTRILRN